MALPRPSCFRGPSQTLGRTAARRTVNQARSSPFRNAGRRTYASGHEAKKSSDLPWMIGAVVFTVPAASWLLAQAPAKQPHGDHGHGEEHEESSDEAPAEEEAKDSTETEEKAEDDSKDESKSDSKDDSKDDSKNEAKDDGKDEEKSDDKADTKDKKEDDAKPDDEEADGPSSKYPQSQYFRNPDKKPGEGHKGDRPPTETRREKDAQSNFSGAKHPYIDDAEKSKKSHGPTETAKIHGTVKPTYHPDNFKDDKSDDGDDKKDDDKKDE